MARAGADLVIEALVAGGVRHVFTLSGNQILSLYDRTLGRGIRLIHTRHEAAAVHMADAWGRLTDEPGVALVTAGPGHANAVGALYGALMAESPVVLLSGHAPRRALGTGAFQEMDQAAVARPVTKAAWVAEEAGRLGDDVARALAVARTGRPGPVHVSLPSDLLEAAVDGTATPAAEAPEAPPGGLAEAREILALLAAARRPLILTGPALGRGARWTAVRRLADATRVPALVMESPRGVDDPGLRGAAGALAEADLVLLVGKRLDFTLAHGRPPAFAPGCRFLEAPTVGSVHALADAAAARDWPERDWGARVTEARRTRPAAWAAILRAPRDRPHPLDVCAALQPLLDAGAVLVSDGGEFGQWIQAGLDAPLRLINGPAGAIGSALPMALAARLAHPERLVVAAMGDGTFGYHALELDTAARHGLPVVAVVGNDARWNAEYQLQVRLYGPARAVGCELAPCRYDLLAAALGGHGELVQRPADLAAALARAAGSGRPACVNVLIEGAAAPTFRRAAETGAGREPLV
jgi:acetolactate synthase-1/2/3 large subunit